MTTTPDAGPARLRTLALRVQLAGFAGTTLDASTRHLLEEGLGGVCLFAGNAADGPVADLVAAVRSASPSPVVAVDEEGGDVTRLHAATGSPHPGHAVLGAAHDPEWTREVGRGIGAELAGLGINLVLGPVADVNSNAANPVIGVRSFGADPDGAAAHVAAWVEGVQASGVGACAKHFPGHGDTHEDSHLGLPVVDPPLDVLAKRELVPFRAAVRAGVAAVMTGHLVVPAVDGVLPASLSAAAHALLRDRLGFTGAVVTDALDMAGASAGRGVPEAAVLALAAGADLLCLGQESGTVLVREVQDALVSAVLSGRLSAGRLEEAASRVEGLGTRPLAPARDADHRHAERIGRTLRVEGELPRLEGASTVLVETEPSIAVGAVPWGLPADVTVGPGASVALPGSAAVVLQVRDAHRHPAVLELATSLAGDRPTVVVEWGWPGPWELPVPRVVAYGSSLPGHQAVRALLAAHGYRGADR